MIYIISKVVILFIAWCLIGAAAYHHGINHVRILQLKRALMPTKHLEKDDRINLAMLIWGTLLMILGACI